MSPASLARAVPIRGAARTVAPATRRYASHGHGPQFNEPSGWLFAEKPSPTGEKRKKPDWERPWFWGMYGGMGLAAVLLYYKPDTTIQTWALQEAKTRMEARGEKTDYP
ncbi:hypothetical protein BDW22DRAFT_1320133 [Trametopsis cervina]|nr:hypothetical protein BDW22DRAFT_1320133 [Trametopsis cervina]